MEVHVKETAKKFRPVTLSLTIESKDELVLLWHRFNLGVESLRKGYSDSTPPSVRVPDRDLNNSKVWNILDSILKGK